MSTQLEIQPRELKFVVELGKQSKCTVRLTNRTDQYVAFKVKTTSPKKYCVRPNVGVLQPKEALEFVVIMQAQKTGLLDLTCKDKFLIQNTIVPAGTVDEDVTSEMFSKDGGRYVEESKLRVFLAPPPPSSPELTPITSTLKQAEEHLLSKTINNGDLKPMKTADEFIMPKTANNEDSEPVKTTAAEHVVSKPTNNEKFKPMRTAVEHAISKAVNNEEFKPVEIAVEHVAPKALNNEEFKLVKTAVEHVVSKTMDNGDLKPVKTAEVEPIQDVKAELIKIKNVKFEPNKFVVSSEVKDVESESKEDVDVVRRAIEPALVMEPRILMSEEEQKLFKDVEEMKSKLHQLESKLSKAEVTISKLREERQLAFQDRETLQQEMAFLRKRKAERRVHDGFPLLFVCMVAIISLVAGYGFHP